MPNLAGFLLQQLASRAEHAVTQCFEFTCDACERPFRGEPTRSDMLPCSILCGAYCRDEAEQGVIDAFDLHLLSTR